jgi:hypothetical protein
MLRGFSALWAAVAFPASLRAGCKRRRGPYDDEAVTEFNRFFAQSSRVLRPTPWM